MQMQLAGSAVMRSLFGSDQGWRKKLMADPEAVVDSPKPENIILGSVRQQDMQLIRQGFQDDPPPSVETSSLRFDLDALPPLTQTTRLETPLPIVEPPVEPLPFVQEPPETKQAQGFSSLLSLALGLLSLGWNRLRILD